MANNILITGVAGFIGRYVLFVGTHYAPNAEGINFFLNSILPIIIREQPNIKLAIVGKVVELLQLDPALNQNVFCLGFIPDLAEV
jgi:hypothetical protein